MYPIWCLLILLFEIFPCILAKLLQLCPTLYDTMDCNPPGSLVHGIPQARTLEWVAMPSSRGSFWPRVWTHILSDEIKVTLGFYGCFLWSSTNVIQLPFMFQLCLPSYIYPAVSSLTLPICLFSTSHIPTCLLIVSASLITSAYTLNYQDRSDFSVYAPSTAYFKYLN